MLDKIIVVAIHDARVDVGFSKIVCQRLASFRANMLLWKLLIPVSMPLLNGRHFSTRILQIESICKSGTKKSVKDVYAQCFCAILTYCVRNSCRITTAPHVILHGAKEEMQLFRLIPVLLNRKYCTREVMYISPAFSTLARRTFSSNLTL